MQFPLHLSLRPNFLNYQITKSKWLNTPASLSINLSTLRTSSSIKALNSNLDLPLSSASHLYSCLTQRTSCAAHLASCAAHLVTFLLLFNNIFRNSPLPTQSTTAFSSIINYCPQAANYPFHLLGYLNHFSNKLNQIKRTNNSNSKPFLPKSLIS